MRLAHCDCGGIAEQTPPANWFVCPRCHRAAACVASAPGGGSVAVLLITQRSIIEARLNRTLRWVTTPTDLPVTITRGVE